MIMAENLEHYCFSLVQPDLPPADQVKLKNYKAAVLKAAKWQPGDVITIRFLGGDPGLKQRVQSVASEWMQFANLQLDFRNSGPTDIRIAFLAGKGSWSYLGTVCRQISEPQPTMNYGWLTPQSSDSELRRVVLHEFGHALGLIHEHQNPKGGIEWNKPAVIHDLSGPPNNWNATTIENNMFHHYPVTELIPTDVDPKSIMMYPIPKAWTLDGFSADLNGELSDVDKNLIRSVYPS
jgi:serralysin